MLLAWLASVALGTAGVVQDWAWRSVTLGGTHGCALTAEGAAYCWNGNSFGQLGDGSTGASGTNPVPVTGGLRFASLSAGSEHTCGVTADSLAYCWGTNARGQLGVGSADSAPHSEPMRVAGRFRFVSVSAGLQHTCGVTTGGALVCWGAEGVPERAARDACGRTVVGDTIFCATRPVLVLRGRFIAVSAGTHHTCAVSAEGVALCWGSNEYGALGRETPLPHSSRPGRVVTCQRVAVVTAGGDHTCGLTTHGTVACWGRYAHGQLGAGLVRSSRIAQVADSLVFTSVNAGSRHTCGVTAEGIAYCWGSNDRNQLGAATTESCTERPRPEAISCSTRPLAVSGGLRFSALSAGQAQTCGVTTEGALYCWGAGQEQPWRLAAGATGSRTDAAH